MIPVVNKLKAAREWDDASNFDAGKDKTQFRQYEDACDRVKTFYKEQHGMRVTLTSPPSLVLTHLRYASQRNKQ